MSEWIEMCEMTRKKLNRELKTKELEWLHWVYERHRSEQNSDEVKKQSVT